MTAEIDVSLADSSIPYRGQVGRSRSRDEKCSFFGDGCCQLFAK